MRVLHPYQAMTFLRAFLRFGGADTLPTAMAVIAGSVLEGIGLALLVPVLTFLVPASGGGDVVHGHRLAGLIAIVPPGWLLPAALTVFCAVIALRGVVLIQRDMRVAKLALGFADAQRHRVVATLAHASWPELTALRHAQVTQILSGEVVSVSTAAHLLPQIVVAGVMICVQFAVLLLVSPALAGVSLVLTLAGAVLLARAARNATTIGSAGVHASFRIADQVAALLGGLKFAAAHGLRHELADRAAAEVTTLTERILEQRRRYSRASVIASSVAAIAGVALVAIGTMMGISTVALLAGLAIILRMSGPLRVLQSNVPQFAALMPAFTAVSALCERLEHAPEPMQAASGDDAPPGSIEARGLCFSHPTDHHPILAYVDLVIAPGEWIGLAGPSGVGKTTLLDIVSGLRRPDAGTITVGGMPLDPARLPRWRRRLAYVTQDAYLFDASMRDNLVWSSETSDDAMLWRALEVVGLAHLVRALPEALDTRVGERGLRFSGGQRQRFALARAILRTPRLLLLDEATSALDIAAEAAMMHALRRALPDASIIVVSHRPEALAMCDCIVALQAGRLVPLRAPRS